MIPKSVVSSLVCMMMLQSGCGTPPVRPGHLADPDKSQLGRVAFVVARYDPQFEFKAQTGGKGEGASKEALDGMVTGAAESTRCGLFMIICLPAGVALGAALGATAGAVDSASAKSLTNANARLQSEIRDLGIPQKLRDALAQYVQRTRVHAIALPMESGPDASQSTPDYSANRADVDTVLEVGITSLKAETLGKKDLVVGLMLSARVRVVSAQAGRVLDTFNPSQRVGFRKVEEWLERGGAPIAETIEIALKELAENAVDETLLIYHPRNLDAPSSPAILQNEVQERPENGASKPPQKELVPSYALRAVFPPVRTEKLKSVKSPEGPIGSRRNVRVLYRLPDLQPTFEWEAFPRGYDLKPGSEPGQARNLRYDFRLYQVQRFLGSEVVMPTLPIVAYEKTGLEAPRHQVEQPLNPCSEYRWTARATFELNGIPRATEWTGRYDGFTPLVGGPVGPWKARRDRSLTAFYPAFTTPASNGGPCPGG